MSDAAREMLAGLLGEVRLSVPEDVAVRVVERGTALGADKITLYLADQEQYRLVPVPTGRAGPRDALWIEATLAGRCFRELELQDVDNGRQYGCRCSTDSSDSA